MPARDMYHEMDSLKTYREAIEKILRERVSIPYSFGELQLQTVFEHDENHYLLVVLGREGIKRVHGCLVHIDIINDKIWTHRDETESGKHLMLTLSINHVEKQNYHKILFY